MIYHIHAYARGVDKRITFKDDTDYIRFLLATTLSLRPKAPYTSSYLDLIQNRVITIRDFTVTSLNRKYGKPKINILSAILMPNHFHLHISFRSAKDNSQFFQRLIGSYTKYFNFRYKRDGRLFSSTTKKVPILTDEQNLYLTKYIHTNPIQTSSIKLAPKHLEKYRWSTYCQYLGKPHAYRFKGKLRFNTTYFCNSKTIMKHFDSASHYKQFVLDDENTSSILSNKILMDQSKRS